MIKRVVVCQSVQGSLAFTDKEEYTVEDWGMSKADHGQSAKEDSG